MNTQDILYDLADAIEYGRLPKHCHILITEMKRLLAKEDLGEEEKTLLTRGLNYFEKGGFGADGMEIVREIDALLGK